MRKFSIQTLIILMFVMSGNVAHAASTEIRAQIAAVRIIVVNSDSRITRIYQNTAQDVVPDVRRGSENGPRVSYSPLIAQQYVAFYQEPPSLIETLYAML